MFLVLIGFQNSKKYMVICMDKDHKTGYESSVITLNVSSYVKDLRGAHVYY